MASAKVLGFDNVSGPTWINKYGRHGYYMCNDSWTLFSSLPGYVTNLFIGRSDTPSTAPFSYNSWSSSGPARIYLPDGLTQSRFIWYSTAGVSVNITASDNNPHIASLYSYDGDNNGRRFRLEVWDSTNTTKFTELSLTTSFASGVWSRVAFQGSVIIKIVTTAGANGVLSGVLFDNHSGKIGIGSCGNYPS